GAMRASVFASGVSAITAITSTLSSGAKIVAEENIYGCTYRLFEQVFAKFGVEVEYLDLTAQNNIDLINQIQPQLVWIESPTNPLLKIIDIESVAKTAHEAGASLVVDNTFASSCLQRPLELGADLSLLSTTKYTNGHSDTLGGVVCSAGDEWGDKMVFAQKALGLQPSPFGCWLIQRGLKTQSLRITKHSSNALAVASFFEREFPDAVVRYPFLESHPQYEIAKKQMSGGSGVVTVDLGLTLEDTQNFLQRLKLFTRAESLGGIESLSCHPASMTHASVPKDVRESIGITDSLFRLSVGIENEEDLINDIKSSLPERAS
ncbi:MAG: PLP-dependent transferase, partial [Verrucomicrobiales bacterium]|nr:PLP-dependent transferase [Verrucomicrobiales bacterium]